MRERKYVKLRTNMYEDTKFKIIDMKPERDVIHYIWTRIVALAGKVNCEGELHMSSNIPYTIETLAIEFNRNIEQVKLALGVFIELEMVVVNKDNIYIVKNFAKHQNIKVKEKSKVKESEEEITNEEVKSIEDLKSEAVIGKCEDENKESEKKAILNEAKEHKSDENSKEELSIHKNGIFNGHENIIDYKNEINSNNSIPITLEKKKRKENKKKDSNINFAEEELEDNNFIRIYDSQEGRPLEEGESIIAEWAF